MYRARRFPGWGQPIGHTCCLEPRTGKAHTAEGAENPREARVGVHTPRDSPRTPRWREGGQEDQHGLPGG